MGSHTIAYSLDGTPLGVHGLLSSAGPRPRRCCDRHQRSVLLAGDQSLRHIEFGHADSSRAYQQAPVECQGGTSLCAPNPDWNDRSMHVAALESIRRQATCFVFDSKESGHLGFGHETQLAGMDAGVETADPYAMGPLRKHIEQVEIAFDNEGVVRLERAVRIA